MGSGLFIIDAIVIAIIILPFVLFIYGSNKKQRQLKKALKAEATKQNCTLTRIDAQSNFAIGLDTKTNILFFHKTISGVVQSQSVDLNTIEVCDVNKATRRVKDGTKTNEVIDKVLLTFSPSAGQPRIDLEFFNSLTETGLSGELDMARKWQADVTRVLETILLSRTEHYKEALNLS